MINGATYIPIPFKRKKCPACSLVLVALSVRLSVHAAVFLSMLETVKVVPHRTITSGFGYSMTYLYSMTSEAQNETEPRQ
uniref:Secreted protein n=1 Tax=Steinernema glaseri TaxID=37863 RepID=A0A1I7ZWM5_9BILA